MDDPGFVKLNNARTAFRGVEGALTVSDALAIKHFAEELCLADDGADGRLRYAEVGSYLGLSATIVATACPRSMIFAHDIFPSNNGTAKLVLPFGEEDEEDWSTFSHPPPPAEDFLVQFWSGVVRNGLEGRVVPMRGRSAETLRVHAVGSLDMVLVDGDHSRDGALADLRAVWPL